MECRNCGFFIGGQCIVPAECAQKGRSVNDLYDLEDNEDDEL